MKNKMDPKKVRDFQKGFGLDPQPDLDPQRQPQLLAQNNPHAMSYDQAYKQMQNQYGQPEMNKPAFAGTKNMLQGKENANFNAVQQDVDNREALQAKPSRMPASENSVPSPYMQPKPMQGMENGTPMQKPNIQTQELSPSMNANPPLDNEDLKALGLLPK